MPIAFEYNVKKRNAYESRLQIKRFALAPVFFDILLRKF